MIQWGKHVRPLTVTHRLLGGEVTEQHVACYLARYATKAPNPPDTSPPRLTDSTIQLYAEPARHHGRLISGAWSLGRP